MSQGCRSVSSEASRQDRSTTIAHRDQTPFAVSRDSGRSDVEDSRLDEQGRRTKRLQHPVDINAAITPPRYRGSLIAGEDPADPVVTTSTALPAR